MKEKAVITAAITGSIHTPTMSDYLPITPQQIADEAVRAYEAVPRSVTFMLAIPRRVCRSRCKYHEGDHYEYQEPLQYSRLHHHGRRIGNDSGAAGRPGNPLQTGACFLQCRLHQLRPLPRHSEI